MAVPLQSALQTAVWEIIESVPVGTSVAVLNFSSDSTAFSEYMIDELAGILAKSRSITVVDRTSLDLIRQEQNFNMSDEVSDESAQAIGKMIGAQTIVSGSFFKQGKSWLFRTKSLNVQTAVLEASTSVRVSHDDIIAYYFESPGKINTKKETASILATADNSGRYVEKEAGFSIQIPDGWESKASPFSVYKQLAGAIHEDGSAPNIQFQDQTYDGTLEGMRTIQLNSYRTAGLGDIGILHEEPFSTQSGLQGLKTIIPFPHPILFMYQIFYIFPLKERSKLIIICTFQDYPDNIGLNEEIAFYDGIVKTLRVDKP
ncbi:MAG: CsgG/HfaB family protein [Treponema sp.]|nr:CsgG/HfaB family protein [Treponema sp.]